METLPPPSEEQQIIIQHVLNGDHVIVDAVAGSGKSTVVLQIAKQLATCKNVLQITYNAHLRKEIVEKCKIFHVDHLDVHTYHSLAVKYYARDAFTDDGLREITQKDKRPIKPLISYDMIVLDEVQDMNFIYFEFMVKFIRDLKSSSSLRFPQLIILGDEKQGIYEFRGSDARFLTKAASIWKDGGTGKIIPFHRCTLKTSYRVTIQIAQYLNDILLGEDRLVACKEGEPVIYVRHNERMIVNAVAGKINMFLQSGKYKADDIFILAPSIRQPNIKLIENVLVERGFPIFIQTNEDEEIGDDRVIRNKIVFSSFHSAKGRQRPIVFVLDYDDGFMMQNFMKENSLFHNKDKTHCPNQVYVACSRASEILIVVENTYNKPLPFLQISHTEMKKKTYLTYEGTCYLSTDEKSKDKNTCKISPTELVKHIDDNIMNLLTILLQRTFVKIIPESYSIHLGSVISNNHSFIRKNIDAEKEEDNDVEEEKENNVEEEKDQIEVKGDCATEFEIFEEVSNINGIAIPFIYYSRIFSDSYKSHLYDLSIHRWNDQKTFNHFVEEHMPRECHSTSDFLLSATIYNAANENILSKIVQIKHFDWLEESEIDICIDRMKTIIGNQCPECIEKELDIPFVDKKNKTSKNYENSKKINKALRPFFHQNFYVRAFIDLIMPDTLWELKCVANLTVEHYLQTICYSWIWRTLYPEDSRPFRLFNIRNGECWELRATYPELTEMMVLLLQNKYLPKIKKSDADFLLECSRSGSKSFDGKPSSDFLVPTSKGLPGKPGVATSSP